MLRTQCYIEPVSGRNTALVCTSFYRYTVVRKRLNVCSEHFIRNVFRSKVGVCLFSSVKTCGSIRKSIIKKGHSLIGFWLSYIDKTRELAVGADCNDPNAISALLEAVSGYWPTQRSVGRIGLIFAHVLVANFLNCWIKYELCFAARCHSVIAVSYLTRLVSRDFSRFMTT
jgi:hypothetical protein